MKLRIGILAALAAFAGFAAFADAAVNATIETPICHGRQAKIIGTDGNDVIRGTPGRDVIWGGKGDDTILGSLGNDLLCGGPGADLIHGGRGNDEVDGGTGDGDRVIGDLGDDKVMGGAGAGDEVAGDLGIDIVSGGAGNEDLVHGDYGWDRMSGGAGKGDIASFATDVASSNGAGVWASLAKHRAYGDGDDKLIGAGGPDTLRGGQGSDGCEGAKGATVSCGKEKAPMGSAYVELDRRAGAGGGAGLQIVRGSGPDNLRVAFDEAADIFSITAAGPLATGPGCIHPPHTPKQVSCPAEGPGLWLMADLGAGADKLHVEGSLLAVGSSRFAGGRGNDEIHAGPEDDLVESGPGADKLYGGDGADGLVGGLPGPTFLYGEGNGDLLAAGGGCAGGALVGGPGRDDASFAETQAHPGVLIISFPKHSAWIDEIKGCRHVHLSRTDEDMEGSFDWDVLIGDGRANSMLGQPGEDVFIGNGGDDVIDARDGARDFSIQCGRGHPATKKRKATGKPAGRALTDPFDPAPFNCSLTKH